MTAEELRRIAAQMRGDIVKTSHTSRTPHLGSSLSCVDILAALYFKVLRLDPLRSKDPDRDRVLLSKGHAALALFTALAHKGFFDPALLDDFAAADCVLEEHPGPDCVPGIEFATGSLGHGPSLAVGTALAARLSGRSYRTVAVLGDGELNEGSVWEAVMFAANQQLASLTFVVDYNKWQATDRSKDVMHLDPLPDKFEAFGWEAREVDGHDLEALVQALARGTRKPVAVVAHTVKGKGVSFMENDNNWHYRIPTAAEVAQAHEELGL